MFLTRGCLRAPRPAELNSWCAARVCVVVCGDVCVYFRAVGVLIYAVGSPTSAFSKRGAGPRVGPVSCGSPHDKSTSRLLIRQQGFRVRLNYSTWVLGRKRLKYVYLMGMWVTLTSIAISLSHVSVKYVGLYS